MDATKSLVNSPVTSRLDYCNALLKGVRKIILNKLQNVQNTAARDVTKTSHFCHINPILNEIHWLHVPEQYRIQYKILTHTYKVLHVQSPVYIKELLQVYGPCRDLRSQNNPLILEVPRSRTGSYDIAVLLYLLQNYGTLSHLRYGTLIHSVLSNSHLRHTYSFKRMESKA